MNYTKGEWTLFQHGITTQIMSDKYKVAEGIYNKANAHLIAAAPDMYEALGTIKRTAESSGDMNYLRNALKIIARIAKETLAKAKG